MKRRLDSDLTLFFSSTLPATFSQSKGKIALIGVGGNIGNVPRRMKKLSLFFARHPRVRLLRSAPILKNPPFGYLEQPYFYNTLFLVQTTLSPRALLHFLLYLERRHKRVRTFKNAPRTLDLDIIGYDRIKMKKEELTIPHPHWRERESVRIPLQFLGEVRCVL